MAGDVLDMIDIERNDDVEDRSVPNTEIKDVDELAVEPSSLALTQKPATDSASLNKQMRDHSVLPIEDPPYQNTTTGEMAELTKAPTDIKPVPDAETEALLDFSPTEGAEATSRPAEQPTPVPDAPAPSRPHRDPDPAEATKQQDSSEPVAVEVNARELMQTQQAEVTTRHQDKGTSAAEANARELMETVEALDPAPLATVDDTPPADMQSYTKLEVPKELELTFNENVKQVEQDLNLDNTDRVTLFEQGTEIPALLPVPPAFYADSWTDIYSISRAMQAQERRT